MSRVKYSDPWRLRKRTSCIAAQQRRLFTKSWPVSTLPEVVTDTKGQASQREAQAEHYAKRQRLHTVRRHSRDRRDSSARAPSQERASGAIVKKSGATVDFQ